MRNQKLFEDSIQSSIDNLIDACLDVVGILTKEGGSEKTHACIVLCRDCAELSTMLSVFMMRKSLFAPRIAQLLHETCLLLNKKLKEIGKIFPEVLVCIKTCTLCAKKINSYLKTQKRFRKTTKQ